MTESDQIMQVIWSQLKKVPDKNSFMGLHFLKVKAVLILWCGEKQFHIKSFSHGFQNAFLCVILDPKSLKLFVQEPQLGIWFSTKGITKTFISQSAVSALIK